MKSMKKPVVAACMAAAAITLAVAPTASAAAVAAAPLAGSVTDLSDVSWTAATPGSCSDNTISSGRARIIECESVPANLLGDGLSIRLPGKGGHTNDYPFQVHLESLSYQGDPGKFLWATRTTDGFLVKSGTATTAELSCLNSTGRGGCIIGASGSGFTQNIRHIRAIITMNP